MEINKDLIAASSTPIVLAILAVGVLASWLHRRAERPAPKEGKGPRPA